MTIQYAILGLLSWRPFSGYDLKKVFADSAVIYWSGNNNQIYTALVKLHEEGLVTQEIHYQESLPARKVYTLTEKGRAALKQWVLSTPELPELHNTFLIRLTWADLLDGDELDALLASYAEEVRVQLLMQQEKANHQDASARTRREAYLWEMISQNVSSVYANELSWVREVREGLKRVEAPRRAVGGDQIGRQTTPKGDRSMNYRVITDVPSAYIECQAGDGRIETEQDALDLVAACGENHVQRLLLHAENLADDFYHLRTGLAGAVLQKFANYSIKVAAVLTPELVNQGRFREMVLEANRGNRLFHVFYDRETAVAWLAKE